VSTAVEVHELWKGYAVGVRGCSARISVLRGVSLHVAPGERVGILGSRGAGKTTLLHCISGLRRPDAGLVRVAAPAWATVLLLDEPERDPERIPRSCGASAATLLFTRDPGRLRGRVDRVLLLRNGRVVPLDSPRDAPDVARRVAEPPAPDAEHGGSVR
jgi:hypothetical protein